MGTGLQISAFDLSFPRKRESILTFVLASIAKQSKTVAFRATGEILFLASPSKSIQKEGDPVPLYPSVLAPHLRGDCGTRAFIAQTVLVTLHLPLKPKARQGD